MNPQLAFGQRENTSAVLAGDLSVCQIEFTMARFNSRDNVLAVTIRAFDTHDVQLVVRHLLPFDY